MSFDYRACFTIGGHADAASFKAVLDRFGLELTGASVSLSYDGRRVVARSGRALSFLEFIANANQLEPSATSRISGNDFFFELGFLSLAERAGAPLRVAWLEISDQNLSDLAFALEDRNSDTLKLLVGLYNALGASSMAMGIETSAQQFVRFFAGELSLPELDEKIWTTIQPPTKTRSALLANPARRELVIERMPVITGSFPGADEYFN